MGIPADYNDVSFATRCNFRPPNWLPEPVSMLPIPKDKVPIQECVGEQVTNKEVEIWDKSPMKDRQEVEIWDKSPMKDRLVKFEPKAQFPAKVQFAVDVEMCAAPAKTNQ